MTALEGSAGEKAYGSRKCQRNGSRVRPRTAYVVLVKEGTRVCQPNSVTRTTCAILGLTSQPFRRDFLEPYVSCLKILRPVSKVAASFPGGSAGVWL